MHRNPCVRPRYLRARRTRIVNGGLTPAASTMIVAVPGGIAAFSGSSFGVEFICHHLNASPPFPWKVTAGTHAQNYLESTATVFLVRYFATSAAG